MIGRRGTLIERRRLRVVLIDAQAIFVALAQRHLRAAVILPGGFAEQIDGLHLVVRACACQQQATQHRLRTGMILRSRLAQPGQRLIRLALLTQQHGKKILAARPALFRCGTQPGNRQRRVARVAGAWRVDDAQRLLRFRRALRRRLLKPLAGLLTIRLDALAVQVNQAELVLGRGLAALRALARRGQRGQRLLRRFIFQCPHVLHLGPALDRLAVFRGWFEFAQR
ncbi:conserved hypothetical protein [Ricinus communis]|uniref:Uncharacterized protein n=1 Tax=Ricinus communis TaxID=3988 RepID=B9TH68_RICCO|nr:conserved hypothetical protein [Ricinus communis]